MTVISATDVWAAGYAGVRKPKPTARPLVEHWNGRRWRIAPTPAVRSGRALNDILFSISGSGSNNVWAVGSWGAVAGGYGGLGDHPLALHWDGSAWKVIATPNIEDGSLLLDVHAASSDSVWAVGYSATGSTFHTLAEHWDGSSWSVVPSADAPTGDSYLKGIASISGSDIWAGAYSGTGGFYQTLTEHWDGTSWSLVPSADA